MTTTMSTLPSIYNYELYDTNTRAMQRATHCYDIRYQPGQALKLIYLLSALCNMKYA